MRRLGVALQRAQNNLHREVDQYARTLGLTGTQLSIIDFLSSNSQNGAIYQKDIENEFNIRKPTATNILKLMEEKGLIIRKASSQDVRLKEINLTPKAQEIEIKINSFLNASEKRFEQILGKANKQKLVENLVKLEHFG
ncbi:MAG: MarR family transcriptional regulator [Atopostipes suicloacalis]|nr:MarR family transcriptional regulator [Tetragenococcus koreensis]MDN6540789.1 MarR family transcriptional regulator [Tetragenococcus koreensis]MDN6567371.1 MarR family transcriptional regulator [Tetragenococcus halophilus]MDN6598565.1 MarR family transcriptional regulator [Tetragenococcus koreensis]MDN6731165.1 MarR family transcriptional regulator [Atopostipes suicloacalis]